MVTAGAAYTLAALGPDPGLRTEVLKNQMTTPAGKAVIRVLQASLKQHLVTVSYGPDVLARRLVFGSATSYTAVPAGPQIVQFTTPGEHAAMPVTLAAGTVHTIVVLDDSSGLKIDAVTDAAGSQIMPKGAAAAGFGGTAPHPPANPAPWLVIIRGRGPADRDGSGPVAPPGITTQRAPQAGRDAAFSVMRGFTRS